MTRVHSWVMFVFYMVMIEFVMVESFLHHSPNKYPSFAARSSPACLYATQLTKSSFAELEPYIKNENVSRDFAAILVKQATESLETKVSSLEGRLGEKDLRLAETKALSEALVAETKAHLNKTEALVTKTEALVTKTEGIVVNLKLELVKEKADFSTLKAKHHAETNLRPMLEFMLQQWYSDFFDIPLNEFTPDYSTSKALAEFVALLDDKQSDNPKYKANKQKLQKAIDDVCTCIRKTPKSSNINKDLVKRELKELFALLSADMHDTSDAVLPDGLIGFIIVNNSSLFSLAMSAFFVFFNVPHTVMTNDYKTIRYKFNPVDRFVIPTADETDPESGTATAP